MILLDVADTCARMRAASLDLFEQLGGWVFDTPPGPEQQRWAMWCHRHAWHAGLWAERAPALREFDLESSVASRRGWIGTPAAAASRAAWYASVRAELHAELAELAVDELLDPSTTRTVNLVLADLATDQ